MKYIVIPALRLLWVVIALSLVPFFILGALCFALWHWKLEPFYTVREMYLENFSAQSDQVLRGEQYVVQKPNRLFATEENL